MNLTEFRSNFKYGARPTLFEIFVPHLGSDFKFRAKSTSLPASTVGVINVSVQGRDVHLPGDMTFDTLSVTVIEDMDYKVRKLMAKWMDDIYEFETGIRNTGTVITDDIEIHALDINHSPVIKFKLFNAFPSSIDAIEMNWESKDTIVSYNLTFTFDYFKVI